IVTVTGGVADIVITSTTITVSTTGVTATTQDGTSYTFPLLENASITVPIPASGDLIAQNIANFQESFNDNSGNTYTFKTQDGYIQISNTQLVIAYPETLIVLGDIYTGIGTISIHPVVTITLPSAEEPVPPNTFYGGIVTSKDKIRPPITVVYNKDCADPWHPTYDIYFCLHQCDKECKNPKKIHPRQPFTIVDRENQLIAYFAPNECIPANGTTPTEKCKGCNKNKKCNNPLIMTLGPYTCETNQRVVA